MIIMEISTRMSLLYTEMLLCPYIVTLLLLHVYCYSDLLGPCGVDYYLHTLAYNAAASSCSHIYVPAHTRVYTPCPEKLTACA